MGILIAVLAILLLLGLGGFLAEGREIIRQLGGIG